ncbi:MAG: hypothetical protein PHU85_00590 [Phycisphaerae bacterium]|nr:hypothetical protein [Phycisphaerae bacterium]
MSDDAASLSQAADVSEPAQGTPEYYQRQLDRLELELEGKGESKRDALDIKREYETWVALAESKGIDMREIQVSRLDPLRQLLQGRQLIEMQEPELLKVRDSMDAAEALSGAEGEIKKKWIELIDLTLELQRRARSHPALLTIYVVRCQSTGDVLRMAPMHMEWFAAWNDPGYLNTVILAPPGTGKTTCLFGQDLWDLARDSRLRILKQCGDLNTAEKRLAVVRLYVVSKRFRAVCPHVRLDSRLPDNAGSFTLMRTNVSQDATMEAAGATSNFQGAGFDIIEPDDLCPLKVRWEKSTRDRITQAFTGVTLMRRRDLTRSKVRYIATPWYNDDTTNRLMREIRDGKRPGWRALKFVVREDVDGIPIPPVDRPGLREELLALKRTDPVMYACACKMDTRDKLLRKLERIHYYDVSGGTDPLCPVEQRDYYRDLLGEIRGGQKWRVFDPAAGGADKTGDVLFAKTVRGRAGVLEANFYGLTADKVIEAVCGYAQKDENILIESQGPAKGIASMWALYFTQKLGPDFRKQIFFSGTRIRDSAGQSSGQNLAKEQRYFNCSPLLSSGVVLLPGKWESTELGPSLVCVEDPGLQELNDQLLNYPDVTNDDGVDCMSLFCNYHAGDLVRSVEPLARPRARGPAHRQTSTLYRVYAAQLAAGRLPRGGVSEAEMFSAA